MIRVLHLITGLHIAGAETLLQNLILASDRREFEHQVISMLDVGRAGACLITQRVKVEGLGMRSGVVSFSAVPKLVRILKRSRPDLLYCWMYHANLLGLVAGKISGVRPIAWSIHGSDDPELRDFHRLTGWVVAAGGWTSRLADCIVFNSRIGREVHQAWNYDMSNAVLIPSGFDLERFMPDPTARVSVRAELGLDEETVLIGMMARWHPVKDHANLLNAAELVLETEQNVHFLLAGEGVVSDNPALRRMIREGRLGDRVHLLGFCDDVPRLTAALDISCLSSRSESFANVLAEAMACEVPCVATNCGEAVEVIGDTGRVVPARNSEALAAALAELVRLGAEGRQELGRRARQRIKEHFSLERFVGDFEGLFRRLTKSGGSSQSRGDNLHETGIDGKTQVEP